MSKNSNNQKSKTRTIKVDYLARVEGEGALYIKTKGDRVEDVQLKIFEPPRFFEAFLRGRHFNEVADITARICGICPVAYQMSAVTALENAFAVNVPEPIQAMRRALYCGEWIESHTLHIYMLHAPDFLKYDDAVAMAKDHPKIVERGLALKKAGNEIVRTLGGREIHPINVKVGGFYAWPRREEVQALIKKLEAAKLAAAETVRWTAQLSFPDFELDYEFVSLRHSQEYPMNGGRVVSSRGLDIAIADYDKHFEEIHLPHTNALHSKLKARGEYFVGPLARYNLNGAQMTPETLQLVKEIGFALVCKNPFQSIVVRALEVHHAIDEALCILNRFDDRQPASVEVQAQAGVGYGCTEAPRGLLYHNYRVNEEGLIEHAQIVPPTSQNQKTIEVDLRGLVEKSLHLSEEDLTRLCEQSIRNYDPCISCATHFLKLERVDE